jgi:alpha-1,3-mannosyl-glycoprotein beta-1,2-N-acetylglucosaminyltransferase
MNLHQSIKLTLYHKPACATPLPAEDDMEISPDFFDYFAAFHPLLRSDKSMYCISSWNDNGKHFRVNATDVFYRSDFFPGTSIQYE